MKSLGSISTRVAVYATTVLTVVGLAVTYAVYAPHQEILKKKELERLRAVSSEQHNRILDKIVRLREDAQFLAATPPLAGIARARAAGGRDPLNGDTEEVWRGRLQTIFESFIRRRPDYAQVRLIDAADDGFELVRIDRVGPHLLVSVSEEQLQRKGESDYVRAAVVLPREGVYLSPINLNREYDRVSLPRTPTIRAATPAYGLDGEPYAVIVINHNLTSLFEELERGRPRGGGLYLTNTAGDYLVDTATQLTFGFDVGRPRRLQEDIPELVEFYEPGSDVDRALFDLAASPALATTDSVLQMTRIQFDPADTARFLGLGLYSSNDVLLGDSSAVGSRSAWAAVGMIVTGSLLLFGYVRRLLRPLALVATSTKRVAAGEYDVELPEESNDEIGNLSRSFRSMVDQIEERNNTLEERAKEIGAQQSELINTNARLEAARQEVETMAVELQQASQYNKSEFLARMAHDIRTPLNSMLLLARPLAENKDGNLTPEQQESARILTGSGADLLTFINDLLDLSKVEAGKLEIAHQETNIAAMVERIRSQLQPLAQAKGLQLRVEIDAQLPEVFITDPRRLRQILSNLLSNAIKFTETGSVTLTARRLGVSHDVHETSDDKISLAVRDTGPGIPAEKIGSIFSPYQRLDRDVRSGENGSGLGLAIVKELTTALSGELKVDSRPGEGSTFELRLPLQAAIRFGKRRQGILKSQEQPAPEDGQRVLVVDDNGATRWALVRAFQKYYPALMVDEAESGPEALGAIRERSYRCVVLDLQLPQLDGWDVLRSLDAEPPKTSPHILIYSGREFTEEEQAEARRLSAVIVPKDGDLEAILDAARPALGRVSDSAAPSRRLLLVEDDPDHSFALGRELVRLGAQIEIARTGREAIDTLGDRRDIDAVLMDMRLPVMDGYEAIRLIRLNGPHRHLPVVAVTGSSESEERERCLAAGATLFKAKPVDPRDLMEELERCLNRSNRGRTLVSSEVPIARV